MVWWINKLSRPNYFNEEKITKDALFLKTNVMFNFHYRSCDAYDIHGLWCSGVNIFNVDRTIHDENFFEDVKIALDKAKYLNEPKYYRPIGFSVTMSVNEIIEVNEKVDIIILKEVQSKDDLIKFRKLGDKHSSKPILLWLTNFCLEDIKELIKFSDGVVIDRRNEMLDEICHCPLKLCREAHRPIFWLKPEFIQDNLNHRRVMITASQIVKHCFDGVVLEDNREINTPSKAVRTLVMAIRTIELGIKPDEDYFFLSIKVKTPIIPTLSVAMSASLAALQAGAKAIFVLTATGRSAHWVSCAFPPCHVLAITSRKSTVGQLHLYRKILPLLYKEPPATNWQEECWNRVRFGTTFALTTGLFSYGAKLVVLAPSEEGTGYCNGFQIVSAPPFRI